jgi:selenocysteine lyase/cysteine desulfurase
VLPIDMQADDIDYLCVAAHKGLYAPMGMGILLCRERLRVPARIQGGTGSQSTRANQPQELPERLESGTANMLGISGLMAGLRFVENRGREAIYTHEIGLLSYVYERLSNTQGVHLYTKKPTVGYSVPVLSVNIKGLPSEQLAYMLDQNGVAVRAGLHCAPLAHRHFGTLPDGTVRLAPSVFSNRAQADKICKLFNQIAQKTLHS